MNLIIGSSHTHFTIDSVFLPGFYNDPSIFQVTFIINEFYICQWLFSLEPVSAIRFYIDSVKSLAISVVLH